MLSNVMTYRRNSDFSFQQDLRALVRAAANISARLKCMSEAGYVIRSNSPALAELAALLTKASSQVTCLERSLTTLSLLPSPSSTSRSKQSTSTPSSCQQSAQENVNPYLLGDRTPRAPTPSATASLLKKATNSSSRTTKTSKVSSSRGSRTNLKNSKHSAIRSPE